MRTFAEVLAWWAACVGVWLLTDSSLTLSDSLIAVGCALPCAVLAVAGRRAVQGSWAPSPRWVRWLVVVPVAVVADGVRVLGIGLTGLVGRRPDGELRTVRLPRDRPAARWRARQAVATAVVSVAPGTVVVDVDEDSGRMVLHDLGGGRPALEEVVRR